MAGPANFKMANLARTKESLKPKSTGKLSPDPYSYEHRITLDQAALDKLGIDTPKVGDEYHVLGHGEVKSVSQNDHGAGDKSTRVELQFKRMGMKPKAKGSGGLLGAVNAGIKQAESD
jgi:hypothetical protein